MNPLPSIARRGLVAAAAALALSPALASADSIVYVKDANVWLASGDGGNQYQVTTDGTAEHPYRSPSQADDGTIAVGHGTEILRMKQNGTVLNRLDPPTLMNSVSHPMDGTPRRRRDLPRRHQGRLHLLRLRVPGRRLLRRPHHHRDHPLGPLRRDARSTARATSARPRG